MENLEIVWEAIDDFIEELQELVGTFALVNQNFGKW
jgi:hypothetical protein